MVKKKEEEEKLIFGKGAKSMNFIQWRKNSLFNKQYLSN